MRNFKSLMAVAALGIVLFSSCSKDDDPKIDTNNPGGSTLSQYFGIKQGSVVYDFMGTNYVYFDDYGKQFRESIQYGNKYIDDETWIVDETAQKAYHLNDTKKTYQEVTIPEVKTQRDAYVLNVSDASYAAAGYTKTTQTIAGKNCSIYSVTYNGSVIAIGGWNNIVFLMSVDDSELIRATQFSETIPANMFTLPSGYTKEN